MQATMFTFILTALDFLLDPNFIPVPTISPASIFVDMIFATCLIWYRVDVTVTLGGGVGLLGVWLTLKKSDGEVCDRFCCCSSLLVFGTL
jgi:hypothetical protein